ncbi:MAG TPA: tripartite tricarboxylate transporter substrate binding protein [Xanthobacteraceae bacterium]|nr:tripartite tricarboxylate transporter substrate binding protein [Xanthobacteraceae bacterium]
MKAARRDFLRFAAGAASAATFSRVARGQAYPARAVRLLVGFPPGGGSDVGGRILANRLSEVWGQQVFVENKPGAGGHLAIEVAAHAVPDGYTIVWVGGAIPLYGLMIASIKYDPEADLRPVTLVGTYPNILAVPNASPLQSVRDLIAAAKARPGAITFSSPGVGTSPHLSGVLFGRMAGIDIRHVPYRGGAPALTDLIAGRVDCMFNTTGTLLTAVRANQVRGLAVTARQRFPTASELPTIAESGVPDYDVTSWYALYVPAKTPAPFVQKISHDVSQILAEPAVMARYDQLGVLSGGSTPEELGARGRSEAKLWRTVMTAAGITPE